MKKIVFYVLPGLLFLLLSTLSACKDDEETPLLKIPEATITLEATETTQTFILQANVGWVIHSSEKWCKISPEYGTGTQQISITLDGENSDTKNDRTAILTIESGQTASQTIEIIQQATPEDEEDEDDDDEDDTNDEELPIKEYMFDTANNTELNNKYGVWMYFSFEKGEVVGKSVGSLASDAKWKERTDWDIAFTRFYTRTNSGESGNGSGGVIEIGGDENDKETLFKNLKSAPESGYTTDVIIEGMMVNMPPMGGNIYNSGGNETLNSWLDNTDNPPVVHPKVFAVKTADGKYVKIYLKEYDSGQITMQYVYQPDGTPNLETTE